MDGAPKKGMSKTRVVKDQRSKQGATKKGRIVVVGKLKHKWSFK